MRTVLLLWASSTILLNYPYVVLGCTNLVVTKGASADGGLHFSYSADSGGLFGELRFLPAADHAPGSVADVWEWDTGRYLGAIPQVAHTYKVVGHLNEWQVSIGETTFGGVGILARQKAAKVDYGSLILLALQRSRSAREAISVMTDLVASHGYASEGETFTIGDPNEVWLMEMIGSGFDTLGAVWVARRVPDGYVTAHANQARITTFPRDDPDNCVYAPNVVSVAVSQGLYPADAPVDAFSFSDVYDPLTFGGARSAEARVWDFFSRVVPGFGEAHVSYAAGHNLTRRMPLWVVPAEPVSVSDTFGYMRSHFEGTPFDMSTDLGAGPYGSLYRASPLYWEATGSLYVNERPIATQQTGWHFVVQLRHWLPDAIGGLLWFGVDDTGLSVRTPVYGGVTAVAPSWTRQPTAHTTADAHTFSFESAFWTFNLVANMVYSRWRDAAPIVLKRAAHHEQQYFRETRELEQVWGHACAAVMGMRWRGQPGGPAGGRVGGARWERGVGRVSVRAVMGLGVCAGGATPTRSVALADGGQATIDRSGSRRPPADRLLSPHRPRANYVLASSVEGTAPACAGV